MLALLELHFSVHIKQIQSMDVSLSSLSFYNPLQSICEVHIYVAESSKSNHVIQALGRVGTTHGNKGGWIVAFVPD